MVTRRRSDETPLEKCPRCHSYFVEPGEICNNCKLKEESGEARPDDNNDAE